MCTFQGYIMDPGGGLRLNTVYTLEIFGLRRRSETRAFINEQEAEVDYLVELEATLDLGLMTGGLYVGGYRELSLLEVSRWTS